VVQAAGHDALTKVIIETALLTEDEKVRACRLAKEANADFVKTATGFSGGGATVDDIRLMRQTVGPEMGVKASSGVRDLASTKAMFEVGANRFDESKVIVFINGKKESLDYSFSLIWSRNDKRCAFSNFRLFEYTPLNNFKNKQLTKAYRCIIIIKDM